MPASLQRALPVLSRKNGHAARQAAALIRSISRWSVPRTTICIGRLEAGAFREDLLYRIQEYSLAHSAAPSGRS